MIHYLYVGHFQPEGNFIRFAKSSPDAPSTPVTLHPLEADVVAELLSEKGTRRSAVSAEWHLWFEDGYLVCDKYTRSRDALNFLVRLAKRTGCDIVDYTAQARIRPEDLTYQWDGQPACGAAEAKQG
jgi:hypothetical protein